MDKMIKKFNFFLIILSENDSILRKIIKNNKFLFSATEPCEFFQIDPINFLTIKLLTK